MGRKLGVWEGAGSPSSTMWPGKGQTGLHTDAAGDFACLVFIFWPFIDVFLCMYLNTYYASCVVSIQPNHAIKTSTTASGIRKTTRYPVRDLSTLRAV